MLLFSEYSSVNIQPWVCNRHCWSVMAQWCYYYNCGKFYF